MKTLLVACIAGIFLWSCGTNTSRDKNEINQDTVRSGGIADTSIRDTSSYERMPQKMNDSTKN